MELFLRIIKTAWSGFRRNGWLSFVATFTMMQALLLITLLFSLNVAVNRTIQTVNDRIDVAIFFKEFVPETDILVFKDEIDSVPGVKAINFISQEQALKNYQAQNLIDEQLQDIIGTDNNYLPASLEVKIIHPDRIEEVVTQIISYDTNQLIATTTFKDNQTMINQLRKINRTVGLINVLLGFIFIIIALLIIFNTIRIAIFTRREEIEIMKLVGATDWYIRWPFIIEGMIYGIVGAIWAFATTLVGYLAITSGVLNKYLSLGVSDLPTTDSRILLLVELLIMQLVLGIIVGGASSLFSTKKHLRV
ncbi:permease-like cell division protein FtsX [Patescibacteria group bacterium]|nr:permease-like cell division protein FtsX [Patescibacteria group bacterium]